MTEINGMFVKKDMQNKNHERSILIVKQNEQYKGFKKTHVPTYKRQAINSGAMRFNTKCLTLRRKESIEFIDMIEFGTSIVE